MNAPLWTSTTASAATGAERLGDWRAGGVQIDSRAVSPNDLFVAIVGDRLDGHDYAKSALDKGAAAVMAHRQIDGVAARDPRLLLVPDTLAGLEALARAARARTNAKIAAVTGSVGKTGVKEMLGKALGAAGDCHISQGNLNNHWGAPLSMARMPADSDFAVIELGMNHAGEIRKLVDLVRPEVAIVTRIAAAHTAFFADIEAVADAKAEIFEGLQGDATAILNADDPMTPRLASAAEAAGAREILFFGAAEDADVRLLDLEMDEAGSTVRADVMGQEITWRIGAAGRHWAMNSLAVIAGALALGGDRDAATAALADMRAPLGRGERRSVAWAGGGFDIVDESYNASPAAVDAAFQTLAITQPRNGGRRVVILGDMLELGDRAGADHANLAQSFTAAGLDIGHAVGPHAKRFLEALPQAARGQWAETSDDLGKMVGDLIQDGDVVLVKGSLGMGMASIVRALEALATDREGVAHAV